MPVKKSQGRRRGIPRGVLRHKLGSWTSFPNGSEHKSGTGFSLSAYKSDSLKALATQGAEWCFNLTSRIRSTLCLIPVVVTEDTLCFAVAPFWRRVIHVLVMVFLFFTCLHKLIVAVVYFVGHYDTPTVAVLSCTGFQLQMTAVCAGIALVFMPYGSCELLNSWRVMLSEMASRLARPTRSPWSSFSSCFQVISTCVAPVIATFGFPLEGLVFPTTPIFVFGSLKSLGIFEFHTDNRTYEVGFRFVCFVTDVTIYGASLSLMSFSIASMLSEIGVLKVLVSELR